MAEAILDLRLDTVQPNRVRLVYGVQNDYNSRFLAVRFTVNGKPIDIESTAAVRINAKRPDGNKDAFPGTVNTDGTAKVPVAQWMLDVPGEVSASITAVTTGGALTTQEFYIMAKASIWDSTGEPSAENPDKDVLQTIIASENERVAAESTRVANENARKSAETARATAETKRIADEATRVVNEAGRVSAEEIRREEFATWQDEWGKISSFDKRLENIEAAISPEIVTPVTDSTVAYTKTVPKGALPNAAITEIGGMSYRCENLIPFPYTFGNSITTNGVTIKANADGSITLNGTLTASQVVNVDLISNYIVLPAGTYRISGIPASGNPAGFVGSLLRKDGSLETYVFHHTFTITEAKRFGLILQFTVGSSFSNQTLYPMLNKGETALPYQPYFTGLRDSKVTAVESVGANCIPFPYSFSAGTYNGVTLTINSDGTIALNGTATGASYLLLQTATLPAGTYYVSDSGENDWKSRFYVSLSENYFKNSSFTLTEPTLVEFRIAIYESFIGTATLKPMVNRGTEALPYSLYFRETLPIPGDALDGFGQGTNKDCCNKIVLDPLEGVKKYVRAFKKIKLKDLSWGDGGSFLFYADPYYVGALKATESISAIPNMVAEKYTPSPSYYVVGEGAKTDKTICEYLGYLYVYDTSCSTVDEFLAALGDAEIVYQLATPTETDVSHLFTDDNLLPVEAGGTITAVNEYEQEVPFSIEYTVKGA